MLVPLVPVRLLPFSIHSQVLLDVLLDGNPAVVDVDGRTEDVDPFEDAPVLLQNQADQSHGFPRFGRSEEMPVRSGTTGSEGCLLLYSGVGMIFPMTFLCVTCQIRRREAGRRVCQRTATQQDADGVFRAIRAGPGVRLCVPTRSQSFQGAQCCAALRSLSFPDKPKGWYAAEVLWK